MSPSRATIFLLGLWLGSAGIGLLGSLVDTPDIKWRAEAISHHAAHYDPQSGKFTWDREP